MRSKFVFPFLTVLLFTFTACGIRRDKPLYPNGNSEIEIPSTFGGLTCSASGTGTDTRLVRLTWNSNNSYDTDGYYIYRSLSYYSTFAVVDTVMHISSVTQQTYIQQPTLCIFPNYLPPAA